MGHVQDGTLGELAGAVVVLLVLGQHGAQGVEPVGGGHGGEVGLGASQDLGELGQPGLHGGLHVLPDLRGDLDGLVVEAEAGAAGLVAGAEAVAPVGDAVAVVHDATGVGQLDVPPAAAAGPGVLDGAGAQAGVLGGLPALDDHALHFLDQFAQGQEGAEGGEVAGGQIQVPGQLQGLLRALDAALEVRVVGADEVASQGEGLVAVHTGGHQDVGKGIALGIHGAFQATTEVLTDGGELDVPDLASGLGGGQLLGDLFERHAGHGDLLTPYVGGFPAWMHYHCTIFSWI